MEITALGNAVMQLGPRDYAIGWTIEGLQEAIADRRVSDGEVLEALQARIREDYAEVFLDDLPVPSELPEGVPAELLDRLATIERQAAGDRAERLREFDEDDVVPEKVEDVEGVDLEKLARSPLFLAKRARLVRTLLGIHDTCPASSTTRKSRLCSTS